MLSLLRLKMLVSCDNSDRCGGLVIGQELIHLVDHLFPVLAVHDEHLRSTGDLAHPVIPDEIFDECIHSILLRYVLIVPTIQDWSILSKQFFVWWRREIDNSSAMRRSAHHRAVAIFPPFLFFLLSLLFLCIPLSWSGTLGVESALPELCSTQRHATALQRQGRAYCCRLRHCIPACLPRVMDTSYGACAANMTN